MAGPKTIAEYKAEIRRLRKDTAQLRSKERFKESFLKERAKHRRAKFIEVKGKVRRARQTYESFSKLIFGNKSMSAASKRKALSTYRKRHRK